MTPQEQEINQLKSNFSVRLSEDELFEVNQVIPDYIADISGRVTTRSIFMSIFRRAEGLISKKGSLPADLEKIEKLEKEVASLNSIQDENRRSLDLKTERIHEIEAEFKEYESKAEFAISDYVGEIETKNVEIEELRNQLTQTGGTLKTYTENPQTIVIKLTPEQYVVTALFRIALQEKVGAPVTTGEMMFDLFWSYITEQNTQIAFPFFFSKSELRKVLQGGVPVEAVREFMTKQEIKEYLREIK